MSLIERLRFFWDARGAVRSLIEEWLPQDCSSERDCEQSLYAHLHRRFKHVQVIRQYARGKARVDLMVDDEIMVEIKFRLQSASEYQRLVGQLVEYKEWKKHIILVLVGATEPSLLKNLKRFIMKEFDSMDLTPFDHTAEIIEKPLVE